MSSALSTVVDMSTDRDPIVDWKIYSVVRSILFLYTCYQDKEDVFSDAVKLFKLRTLTESEQNDVFDHLLTKYKELIYSIKFESSRISDINTIKIEVSEKGVLVHIGPLRSQSKLFKFILYKHVSENINIYAGSAGIMIDSSLISETEILKSVLQSFRFDTLLSEIKNFISSSYNMMQVSDNDSGSQK